MNKADKNPLLTTLKIIQVLSITSVSATALQQLFEISSATLARHIKEARHLGADVVAKKLADRAPGWHYYVTNGELLQPRLDRWIELETNRSLI